MGLAVVVIAIALAQAMIERPETIAAANRAGSPAEQSTLLQHAISLYQGDLLPGFYDDWVLTERNRIADLSAPWAVVGVTAAAPQHTTAA